MIEQVIITSRDGRILFINKAVEAVTGYLVDEVIGKKISELWGGNMNKKFYTDMWNSILNKKESIKLKMRNKKKSKSKDKDDDEESEDDEDEKKAKKKAKKKEKDDEDDSW
jgi:PAS domain S-box-containing protein